MSFFLIVRRCHNGQCLRKEFICDSEKNCFDKSDEICKNSRAIHPDYTESWLCLVIENI